MRINRYWPAVLLAVLLVVNAPALVEAQQTGAQRLEVFVRDGCPHCARAKAYLPSFARQHPELEIVIRPVDNPDNHNAWLQHSFKAGIWPPGVPTFVVGDRVLLGFASPERTGPEIEALLSGQVETQSFIKSDWFGTLSLTQLGLPAFTLAIGLLDGFNPCAMWVLLFLLSMLVHLNDRKRMALIAGTFVVASGLVYYAFMAAWLNIFLVIGLSGIVRAILVFLAMFVGAANVRDFLSPARGFTLSIPESAKPGLYARVRAIIRADNLFFALAAASALAVIVNMIELLCTAGFPAMYTAILTAQDLSPVAHYAYLGLYIVGYMADDTLMVVIAVAALSSHKLTEKGGRWLKLASGVVMLALAFVMLFFPGWLF